MFGNLSMCKYSKGKGHPITGREGPEGGAEVWLYCFIKLGAGLAVGGQRHAPAVLPPGKRSDIQCTGGWVDPHGGLVGCAKSRVHRDSITGSSTP